MNPPVWTMDVYFILLLIEMAVLPLILVWWLKDETCKNCPYRPELEEAIQ